MMSDQTIIMMNRRGVRYVKIDSFNTIPLAMNSIFIGLSILSYLYQFFWLPSLLEHSLWWVMLIPFSLLLVITSGVLVHEAIHNLLLPNQFLNKIFGRLFGILMGVSFDLQRYDHLQHHRYNRTEKNCTDITIGKLSKKQRLKYLYNNLIGLFMGEFFFNIVICFFPQPAIEKKRCYTPQQNRPESSGQIATRQLLANGNLTDVRIDGILILLVNGLSLYCFQNHVLLFLGLFFLRALILTVLDSFAHFKTPVNAKWFAKNIALPKLIGRYVFLNFNLHGVHHIYPTASWVELSNLMNTNDLELNFVYHQNLWQALNDKFSEPKSLSTFPKEVQNFPI